MSRNFFKLNFIPLKADDSIQGIEFKEKEKNKEGKHTRKLIRKRSSRPGCSVKNVFLNILQNSQERCFPVNFAKFLRTPFFYRTPLMAASVERS